MRQTDTITMKAYAKINLGLDVIRRREDGYHELDMIMQTVGMYDVLTFTKSAKPGIRLQSENRMIPTDERNLVYKAAAWLFSEYSLAGGLEIALKKRIPVAAGMAGGSSDCAATIKALNCLYGLNLTKEEMEKIGVKFGADVPYCIMGGTVRAEGIGERLTPLADTPRCHVLLVKPPVRVSTKMVYENLNANALTRHPDISGIAAAIENGDLKAMAERLENVLETVTVKEFPVIQAIKQRLEETGAIRALMSGSGPTVYGIFTDGRKARQACELLRQEMQRNLVFLTTVIDRKRIRSEENGIQPKGAPENA